MTTPRGARGAAPRHDDRRRSFPQVAPREAPDGRFAATWWGNAWVEALEDTALDPARLARGKAYAGRGHVDAITVTPGRVVAYVHGSRPRPYRTEIRMRTLGDDGWERFLDEATARPDHIAALLDKDVPHALEAVAGLLPAPGDLVPDCSCPDDGYPCKHAAALCYQAARLLDEDPFVLFLMRGRGEQELLAELTRRNAALSAAETSAAAPPMPTVPARAVLGPGRRCPLRCRSRTGRAGPPSSRPTRRPPTRSRSTSWPPKPPPAPTRSSSPGRTRSPRSPRGRTPSGWPPPTPAPGSPPRPAPSTGTWRTRSTAPRRTSRGPSPPGDRAGPPVSPYWRSPGIRRPVRSTGPDPR